MGNGDGQQATDNGSCASKCIFPADLPARVETIEEKLGVLDSLGEIIKQRIAQEKFVQAAQVNEIKAVIDSEIKSLTTMLRSHMGEQTAAERRSEIKDQEDHASTVRVHQRLDELMKEMKDLYCLVNDKHVQLGKDLDEKLAEMYGQVTEETDGKVDTLAKNLVPVRNKVVAISIILGLIAGVLAYFQPTINEIIQRVLFK